MKQRKRPEENKIENSFAKARMLGLDVKYCDCGHDFIHHSWGLLGPCFMNRGYTKEVEGTTGDKTKGECDCPFFDEDKFGRLVEDMRNENAKRRRKS
jgi:hypothetical protein